MWRAIATPTPRRRGAAACERAAVSVCVRTTTLPARGGCQHHNSRYDNCHYACHCHHHYAYHYDHHNHGYYYHYDHYDDAVFLQCVVSRLPALGGGR